MSVLPVLILMLLEVPTAQTSSLEKLVTPLRTLLAVPTFGLGTTLQLVPSQCSVRVCCICGVLPIPCVPTAQMSFVEMAVTPLSMLSSVPIFGLGTMVQFVPSQCSISVC